MKWMGWSWDDYCSAPTEIVEMVIKLINEEQERLAELNR